MRLPIFLTSILLAHSCHSASPTAEVAPMATDAASRPNILFIFTDDQRYDALSTVQSEQGAKARFPWLQTPHQDRLAREGVRFRQAFVVNSLCSPSRAVLLTGRYNHHNGIASNFRDFPTGQTTYASLLKAAGYTTGYIGKWHMGNQRERPGFDFVASFTGHARYVDPIFILNGTDTPTQGWIDDISTDHAVSFIRQRGQNLANKADSPSARPTPKPWCLTVGFKSPHGPFQPPKRTAQLYEGKMARSVPNMNTPATYNATTGFNTPMGPRQKPTPSKSTADEVPAALNYFRCITAIDDCVGRLLTALDDTQQAANTVVIYTSDNGFYLGEHGLGDKRSAYDESLRVPFLVRAPMLGQRAQSQVNDAMVLNLDFAPTVLDLAHLPIPPTMQGRSLKPLLLGDAAALASWRQSWLYEYFAESQKSSRITDIVAVRTKTAKLVTYPGFEHWNELFDLSTDPFETNNLLSHSDSVPLRAQLEKELDRLKNEVGYRVPEYTDRPAWWGKPGGPDAASQQEAKAKEGRPMTPVRLNIAPTGFRDDLILDASPAENHAQIQNVTVSTQSPENPAALVFNGHGHLAVSKQASLNPTKATVTLEAKIKPEAPTGVIFAHGGKSNGFCLWLHEGRPVFHVNLGNESHSVEAPANTAPISGWTTLTASIASAKSGNSLLLKINGNTVAQKPLPRLMTREPNEGIEIGADLGSPVVSRPNGTSLPNYHGRIQLLTLSLE